MDGLQRAEALLENGWMLKRNLRRALQLAERRQQWRQLQNVAQEAQKI
jgi:hypothetical protein